MCEKKEFNLSDFICDSLSVNGTAQTRPMFTHTSDPNESLLKTDPLTVLGEVDFKAAKEIPKYSIRSPIQEFFRGVNVFITGGSGFLGKILIEKLLRSIPDIGHIYLLIRSKKGKDYEERFNILLEDKVFSRLKAEVPHYLTKLKALDGDICEPGLGLSDGDRHMIQDTVHVIFHCAADVNFMKPLKHAIAANVLGSESVLNLAKSIIGLKAYVHVSTAFSQCTSWVIEEKIPKLNINYKEILDFVKSNKDTYSEEDQQKIMQGSPNTYIFSKAVSEDMLQEEAQGLPICIVRPTVVTSTYKEPVRGWTDNLYGPMGLLMGFAVGVVHSLQISIYHVVDSVPVDYLANCIIAAAFNIGSHRDCESIMVYNFSSEMYNCFCWKKFTDITKCLDTWPSSHAVWFNSFLLTESSLLFNIYHIFLHKIPGAILDRLASISGRKPRLGKVYTTLETLGKSLDFFMNRFWEFKDDNVSQLWNSLTEEDKKIFHFDVRDINWKEYVTVSWLGMRYYYLKESMDSIPAARRKRKWLRIAHIGLKLVFGVGLLKLAVCIAHIVPF